MRAPTRHVGIRAATEASSPLTRSHPRRDLSSRTTRWSDSVAVASMESWHPSYVDRGPTAVPELVGLRIVSARSIGFVLSGEGLPPVYVSGHSSAPGVITEIAERIGSVDVVVELAPHPPGVQPVPIPLHD